MKKEKIIIITLLIIVFCIGYLITKPIRKFIETLLSPKSCVVKLTDGTIGIQENCDVDVCNEIPECEVLK